MRTAIPAALAALAMAACAPADPAAHAEAKWAQCDGPGFEEHRIAACSEVIDFAGTSNARRAAALVIRGSIRANMGQHARAVADFGRALRIDRANAHAYVERGLVHHSRGAVESAMRDYDSALTIEPDMRLALDRRQDAMADLAGAYASQLDQLTRALASDPDNAEILNNRCWLRVINDDDLDAALADCDAALRANPASAAALDSRGLVHFKRGEYEAAAADYEAALAVEPGRGHYLYGRGLARLRLGMTAEGQADLTAAERAEPGVTALYASYGASPS